jgi:hypothetical protein
MPEIYILYIKSYMDINFYFVFRFFYSIFILTKINKFIKNDIKLPKKFEKDYMRLTGFACSNLNIFSYLLLISSKYLIFMVIIYAFFLR